MTSYHQWHAHCQFAAPHVRHTLPMQQPHFVSLPPITCTHSAFINSILITNVIHLTRYAQCLEERSLITRTPVLLSTARTARMNSTLTTNMLHQTHTLSPQQSHIISPLPLTHTQCLEERGLITRTPVLLSTARTARMNGTLTTNVLHLTRYAPPVRLGPSQVFRVSLTWLSRGALGRFLRQA